jgi:hypothetical protein
MGWGLKGEHEAKKAGNWKRCKETILKFFKN